MRVYKIAHFSNNERAIFRKDDDFVQWLSPQHIWTLNKNHARRYINEDDASSALVVIKSKWELKTEEQYIEEVTEKEKNREKSTWSEL